MYIVFSDPVLQFRTLNISFVTCTADVFAEQGASFVDLCLLPLRLFSIGDTDETLLPRLLVTSVLLNSMDISQSSSNFSLLDIFSLLGL